MSNYRRRNRDDHDHDQSQGFSVPYRDASPDSNEVPLDELDNFIIPGRDEHGGHQTITVSCPPLLVHQIDVAVRTGLFPYINREALVRHAMVRQLRWLQSIRPETMEQHLSPTIEALLQRCFESQMQKKVKAAFDALRETIIQCEHDGEHMEVIRLVNFARTRLDAVGKGSVWQQRAWKRFLAEFAHYLTGAPAPAKSPVTVDMPIATLPAATHATSPGKLRRILNEMENMDVDEGMVN